MVEMVLCKLSVSIAEKTTHRQLKNMVQPASFVSYNLFIKPLVIATTENDQTVNLFIHDSLGPVNQLLQFDLGYLSLEYGILDPIDILPTKLEHLSNPLLANIINQNDIHNLHLQAKFKDQLCILLFRKSYFSTRVFLPPHFEWFVLFHLKDVFDQFKTL